MSSCTLIHTEGIRCCVGVNIAFIKASYWNPGGQRDVCHFYIPQLVPGAVCDFRGLSALSTPWGGVSCVAAHTLEELAAFPGCLGVCPNANPAVQGVLGGVLGCRDSACPERRKVWWYLMASDQLEWGIPLLLLCRVGFAEVQPDQDTHKKSQVWFLCHSQGSQEFW